MSDQETVVTRDYCSICEPTADPLTELLILRFCYRHEPKNDGADDVLVSLQPLYSGTGEGEAANCRAAQAIIR